MVLSGSAISAYPAAYAPAYGDPARVLSHPENQCKIIRVLTGNDRGDSSATGERKTTSRQRKGEQRSGKGRMESSCSKEDVGSGDVGGHGRNSSESKRMNVGNIVGSVRKGRKGIGVGPEVNPKRKLRGSRVVGDQPQSPKGGASSDDVGESSESAGVRKRRKDNNVVDEMRLDRRVAVAAGRKGREENTQNGERRAVQEQGQTERVVTGMTRMVIVLRHR